MPTNDLELIAESEDRLRRVFNGIPAFIFSATTDGQIEFVNRQLIEYTGRTLEELKRWTATDLVHPDDLPRVLEELRRSIETGQSQHVEHRVRGADGQYRWFDVRRLPERDADGRIVRWYLVLFDIHDLKTTTAELQQALDDRKRAEERVRASETEYRRIIDAIPQLISALSPDGGVLYSNRTVFEYSGLEPADLAASAFRARLFHPDDVDRVAETRRRGLEQGRPFELEMRTRHHAGEYRWCLIQYKPVRDEQGRIARWYATGTDIHERKRAEDQIKNENLALREEVSRASMFEEIVGASAALKTVLSRIAKVAPTDTTVFITGETGTGKELIARALHTRSQRSDRAFVSVNCAAFAPTLVSSELFGHEKGAFTGAVQRRLGRFEMADGGTIFLDEVGELLPDTQAALLRVLQEREFERVGGTRPIRVDVRVIAATNRDLNAAVANGSFRQDLFYRLNVFPIEIAPLRERKDDISMLVEYFVQRYATRVSKHFRSIDKKTLDLLRAYDWPGNIRELQNVIGRSVILSSGDVFAVDESWLLTESRASAAVVLPAVRCEPPSERERIEAALAECRGRVAGPSGAAAKLGIPPSTLDHRIKSLSIDKKRFKFRLTPRSESPESPPESPE